MLGCLKKIEQSVKRCIGKIVEEKCCKKLIICVYPGSIRKHDLKKIRALGHVGDTNLKHKRCTYDANLTLFKSVDWRAPEVTSNQRHTHNAYVLHSCHQSKGH